MTWQSEVRAWTVASAAVFALSAIGYRIWTAPAIPDFAPVARSFTLAGDGLTRSADAATGLLGAARPIVDGFQTTPGRLNAAIDLTSHRINDLCPLPDAIGAAIRPCGTLANVNRTLATYRGTAGQLETAIGGFNRQEGALFTQETNLYATWQRAGDGAAAIVTNKDLAPAIRSGRVILDNGASASSVVAAKVERFSLWKPWTW